MECPACGGDGKGQAQHPLAISTVGFAPSSKDGFMSKKPSPSRCERNMALRRARGPLCIERFESGTRAHGRAGSVVCAPQLLSVTASERTVGARVPSFFLLVPTELLNAHRLKDAYGMVVERVLLTSNHESNMIVSDVAPHTPHNSTAQHSTAQHTAQHSTHSTA